MSKWTNWKCKMSIYWHTCWSYLSDCLQEETKICGWNQHLPDMSGSITAFEIKVSCSAFQNRNTGGSQLYVGLRPWKSRVNRESCNKRISLECSQKSCLTEVRDINRTRVYPSTRRKLKQFFLLSIIFPKPHKPNTCITRNSCTPLTISGRP